MKTQKQKLDFTKHDIVELNDTHLITVNGGTSPSSLVCSRVIQSIIASIIRTTRDDDGIFEDDFE